MGGCWVGVTSRHHALLLLLLELLLLLLLLSLCVCFTRLAATTFCPSVVHDDRPLAQRRHCLTSDLVICAGGLYVARRPGSDRLIDGCRPNGRRAAGNLHLDRLLYARLTPSERATAIDRVQWPLATSAAAAAAAAAASEIYSVGPPISIRH